MAIKEKLWLDRVRFSDLENLKSHMVTMKTSMVTNSSIGVNTNHFFPFELACFMIYDLLGKN